MNYLGIQQIEWFICLTLFNSWCCCQNSYFKLENEDTSIIKTNNVKPFLDESVDSEMECYMKCLGDQDKCCLIETKEKHGNVNKCLLYNVSSIYLSKDYERGSKITSVVGRDCKLKPKNCLEWYQKGDKEDDVYQIDVNGKSTKAFCDMTTNGRGWTVLQRRFDGSVSFAQNWNTYKNGFGNANGEYWLGNDLIHRLTNKDEDTLIKIKTTSLHGNVSKYIIYDGFKIDGEENKYKMHIGKAVEGDDYLVSNQDVFKYNDQSYFTTKDQDNDKNGKENCAIRWGGEGGYWYNSCSHMTPNSGFGYENCDFSKCMRWKA